MTRKVFIAGGTGVLGRRVVPLLLAAGHDVTMNVRNDDAGEVASKAGAKPLTVDLFDKAAVGEATQGCDAVVNIATAIPTGAAAGLKRGWALNDRLRTEAAQNLAAATPAGAQYVGESLTFPYVDSADRWIDEATERTYSSATESIKATEAAAAAASGASLRFGMFWAEDSAHNAQLLAFARRGIFALPGNAEAYSSWIHVDDAAAAVVAALDAPPGVYNVAEPDPVRRVDHMAAVAAALGKSRLRGLPPLVVKLGGPPVEALARSQRISSAALGNSVSWEAQHKIVDTWD